MCVCVYIIKNNPYQILLISSSVFSSILWVCFRFCLDECKGLERDRGFVKLQSRLIRYETQSTCCKEPCPVPFTLSPAPSPAVLSEPGSVPDGETLHSEPPRLKRRSRESDLQQHKRLEHSMHNNDEGSSHVFLLCMSGLPFIYIFCIR